MEYKDIERVNSEIETTKIKDKDYAEVPKRVTAFRKLYPEGTIDTKIESCSNGLCVFKATISNDGKLLSTGHAYEKEGSTFINKTSYIENCETSAIGRALGFLGIGIETSIASYEEVANAKLNQDKKPKAPTKEDLINKVQDLCKQRRENASDYCEQAGVKSLVDMHIGQLEDLINFLEGKQ